MKSEENVCYKNFLYISCRYLNNFLKVWKISNYGNIYDDWIFTGMRIWEEIRKQGFQPNKLYKVFTF